MGIEPTLPKQVFYRHHGYLSASRPFWLLIYLLGILLITKKAAVLAEGQLKMKSVFDLPFHPEPPSLSFCPSSRCFGKLGHDGVEFTTAYTIALPQGLKASDVCVKVNIAQLLGCT